MYEGMNIQLTVFGGQIPSGHPVVGSWSRRKLRKQGRTERGKDEESGSKSEERVGSRARACVCVCVCVR